MKPESRSALVIGKRRYIEPRLSAFYSHLAKVLQDSFSQEDILKCVDSGIDVFGSSVKNVIYFRFETIFNLKRADIVRKPEVFSECLRSFFGERGFHVESAIVAAIIAKFHLSDVNLTDSAVRAVVEARKLVWSEK